MCVCVHRELNAFGARVVELCMGRLFVEQLEGHVYSCKHCRMHLAHVEELVSKVRDAQEGNENGIRGGVRVGLKWMER